ncbi:MAG: RdgB/HAM1 family non-canonical purine NTP pyrophosphatase [Methylotenera sp.]|nr:RdgB/HAM1 family non-canonical purine NTP pyrophosphatase [Oligoflexia bacterium]
MRKSNLIVLASTNADKYREFKSLLSAYPEIELATADGYVRNPGKIGFAEQYDTYLENAAAKARLVNLGSHYPSLADDSGLEIDALGGKPGVRSHRYAKVPGSPSQNDQDRANIEMVLSELRGKGTSDRSARFVTTLTLVIEGVMVHATGTLEGSIIETPRGTQGFGYDSIFTPKGSDKTLAEMSEAEKNAISHRAKAVHELMNQVKARGVVLAKP